MIKKKFLFVSLVLLLIAATGVFFFFKLRASTQNLHAGSSEKILTKLYGKYKDGQIDECFLNDKKVFVAGINAYDAAGSIYDLKGENIATCNYAWGTPDKLCEELEKCERIYVVEDNIWGYPPVNKYNLK